MVQSPVSVSGTALVMSDIHFGLPECTLGTPPSVPATSGSHRTRKQAARQSFLAYLRTLPNCNTLILLGDIFDLQLSNLSDAINASRFFFRALPKTTAINQLIYIPGNHDYLLWSLHVLRRHIIETLEAPDPPANGDFPVCSDLQTGDNIFQTAQSFLRNVLGASLRVIVVLYPFLKLRVGAKWYLFTHGHFFDQQQTIYYDLVRKLYPAAARFLRLDSRTIDDPNINELDLYCSPLYYMFTMFGHTDAGRRRMREVYETLAGFMWGGAVDLDDRGFVARVAKFLKLYGGSEKANKFYDIMDYLVFGHTHQAGVNMYFYPENHRLKVLNTGCWLPSMAGVGSFVVVNSNEEHPRLMVVNEDGDVAEHAASTEMRSGLRPKSRPRIFSW